MIRIERIEIENIRGIKHFDRSLGGHSLAIQGPNGSGKSGVIDAIEFGLTGNFSRLKGRGTKNLTPKQHGKHVGSKEGKIRLTISSVEQGREIIVTRSTQNPSKPKIEPNDERSLALIEEIAGHPEIALTRRQIIRFILAESKDRSAELQALLRLERVESICEELRKAHSKCERELNSDKNSFGEKKKRLCSYLQVDELDDDQVLLALNQRRKLLDLDEYLNVDDYVHSSATTTAAAKREINKREVQLEVDAVREAISNVELESACDSINKQLEALDADQSLAIALSRHQLIGFGLAAIDSNECPLCDTEWDIVKLREHLEGKLSQCKQAKEIHEAIVAAASKLSARFSTLVASLQQLGMAARRLAREDLVEVLKAEFEQVSRWREDLKTHQGVDSSRGWLEDRERFSSLAKAIESLATKVGELPEQSERDQAKLFLSDAVRLLKDFREAKERHERSVRISDMANRTYEAYQQTAEAVLNKLYDQVKQEFEESYRFINEEDEGDFESEFITAENCLEIKAKFYNHGNHPPAAYHSEGHQDGMGLCLYLALMNQVFAGDLRLVILDDVVMSIDSGHRKKLCELLRNKFPDTQFIITTHERTWFKQMQTAKLIEPKSALQFNGWTVDGGPQIVGVVESWDAVRAALQADEIPLAAWRLRNYLEYIACELADDLGAKVTYRANGEHAAGELFQSVCNRFRELLKKSARARKSWGHDMEEQDTLDLEKRFGVMFDEINSHEYWMINPAVHYNQWQDFTKKDFSSVVAAYDELLACFTCIDCKTMVRRNSSTNCTEMSCMCGGLNFRFVEATAAQKADRAAAEPPVLKLRASS